MDAINPQLEVAQNNLAPNNNLEAMQAATKERKDLIVQRIAESTEFPQGDFELPVGGELEIRRYTDRIIPARKHTELTLDIGERSKVTVHGDGRVSFPDLDDSAIHLQNIPPAELHARVDEKLDEIIGDLDSIIKQNFPENGFPSNEFKPQKSDFVDAKPLTPNGTNGVIC